MEEKIDNYLSIKLTANKSKENIEVFLKEFIVMFSCKSNPSKDFFKIIELLLNDKELNCPIFNFLINYCKGNFSNDFCKSEKISTEISDYESKIISISECIKNNDCGSILNLMNDNQFKKLLKSNVLVFIIIKTYFITGYGFNKKSALSDLFFNCVDHSELNRITSKNEINLSDYVFCNLISFIANEIGEIKISKELCYKGIEYKRNLYLTHNLVHILQEDKKWQESIDLSFELSIGKKCLEDWLESLKNSDGIFIHSHLLWHVAIALIYTGEIKQSEKVFSEQCLLIYNDSECYVNLIGYLVWYQILLIKKSFEVLKLLTDETKDHLIKICSNRRHYMIHSLFDCYAVWFLSSLDINIELTNELKESSNLLFAFNELGKNNYPEVLKLIKSIDFSVLSGSKEQREILNIIANMN